MLLVRSRFGLLHVTLFLGVAGLRERVMRSESCPHAQLRPGTRRSAWLAAREGGVLKLPGSALHEFAPVPTSNTITCSNMPDQFSGAEGQHSKSSTIDSHPVPLLPPAGLTFPTAPPPPGSPRRRQRPAPPGRQPGHQPPPRLPPHQGKPLVPSHASPPSPPRVQAGPSPQPPG